LGVEKITSTDIKENAMKLQSVERSAFKARSFVILIVLAFLFVACSPSFTPKPLPPSLSDAVSGKVDVGGYELYYTCVGEGSPTVILEAGSEGDASTWELVMLYYRKYTRICAYDRANLGNSDQAPKPRTYEDMTRDLHTLFQNVPIEGPYILVGYSMGGNLVRLYAGQYPEDIAGVVLVDSFHPDTGARLLAVLPPEIAGEDESLKLWREYATWMITSDGQSGLDSEDVNNLVSMEQVRAVKSLGDIPLAIVSRSPDNPALQSGMPPLPDEINAKGMQMWQDLQTEFEGLSSNSLRYIAVRSDHGIPYYEPRLVVEAIHHAVDEYRTQAGIVVPPAAEQTDAASHAPVITGIRERQKWESGILNIYEEISYTDPAGDAITIINQPISAPITSAWTDDILMSSAAEQQQGAVLTTRVGKCRQPAEIILELRVFDSAGNISNPETVRFSCPAPRFYISPILIAGIVLALILLGLGIWLLVRHLRGSRVEKT
jgi:pimeloyl-ACP methyl ester carboxylesterase